jgi:hypothetical protein
MASGANIRGFMLVALAVMSSGALARHAQAQSSFSDPYDPPLIIHGGSLHAAVKNESYNATAKSLTVPVKDVAKVTLVGYKKPPKLGMDWTMQVCNEDPCMHGLVVTAKAGSVTISLINAKDLMAKGRKSIYGETDYELIGTGGTDEYYPAYLAIKQAGVTTKFTCATDPPGDWTSCRIQIGAREK